MVRVGTASTLDGILISVPVTYRDTSRCADLPRGPRAGAAVRITQVTGFSRSW